MKFKGPCYLCPQKSRRQRKDFNSVVTIFEAVALRGCGFFNYGEIATMRHGRQSATNRNVFIESIWSLCQKLHRTPAVMPTPNRGAPPTSTSTDGPTASPKPRRGAASVLVRVTTCVRSVR